MTEDPEAKEDGRDEAADAPPGEVGAGFSESVGGSGDSSSLEPFGKFFWKSLISPGTYPVASTGIQLQRPR